MKGILKAASEPNQNGEWYNFTITVDDKTYQYSNKSGKLPKSVTIGQEVEFNVIPSGNSYLDKLKFVLPEFNSFSGNKGSKTNDELIVAQSTIKAVTELICNDKLKIEHLEAASDRIFNWVMSKDKK